MTRRHKFKSIINEFYRDLPWVDDEYQRGEDIDFEGATLVNLSIEDALTDAEDGSGNVIVGDLEAILSGSDLEWTDNGDGTATLDYTGASTDTDTRVDVENSDGTTLVVNTEAIQAGSDLQFTDDGDGTATLDYTGVSELVDAADGSGNTVLSDVGAILSGSDLTWTDNGDGTATLDFVGGDTDTHVDLENTDGTVLVANPSAVQAGSDLQFTDDGDGTATLDYTGQSDMVDAADGSGNLVLEDPSAMLAGSNVSWTDNGDGTVTLSASDTNTDSQSHDASLVQPHTSWDAGLSNEEIYRVNLDSGSQLHVRHLEYAFKGGGTASGFTVDVYDETNANVIVSTSSRTTGSWRSGTGATVLVRVSNSTGSAQNASITMQAEHT